MRVEPATPDDLKLIRDLLAAARLPVAGIDELAESFRIVRDVEGRIRAAGVVERHGAHGLLRSVVVDSALRGLGVGRLVVEALMEAGREEGLESLFLLTESAPDFFLKLGFSDAHRTRAPAGIRASEEFRSICPESARLMMRSLSA